MSSPLNNVPDPLLSLALQNQAVINQQTFALTQSMIAQQKIDVSNAALRPEQLMALQQDYLSVMQAVHPAAPLDMNSAALAAGPFIGYRNWKMQEGILRSTVNDIPWIPGTPFKAKCSRSAHDAPQSGCGCGIYAYKDRAKEFGFGGIISGSVALWGTLVEHKLGYRAQYAYPLTFCVPKSPMAGFPKSSLLERLAAAYGIYVVEA